MSQEKILKRAFNCGEIVTHLNFFGFTGGTNFQRCRDDLSDAGYRLSWRWKPNSGGIGKHKEWKKYSKGDKKNGWNENN